MRVQFPHGGRIIIYKYYYFFDLVTRQSATLSFAAQHAIPRKFSGKWGTEYLNTRIPRSPCCMGDTAWSYLIIIKNISFTMTLVFNVEIKSRARRSFWAIKLKTKSNIGISLFDPTKLQTMKLRGNFNGTYLLLHCRYTCIVCIDLYKI